jgi:hypothetical protein
MVTQINAKTLYEQDFNLWIEETINLLKNRQLEQIDYEHLIEEIEDMEEANFATIDDAIISMLNSIDSPGIDNSQLVKIYSTIQIAN